VPLACPSCARRYALSERFCRSCGMPLVYMSQAGELDPPTPARERARKVDPEYARGEPVRVGFARNQAEAELMQNILLEEGIPSMLKRSGGFDVPDFLAAGPRDVLVPESGAEAARDVLRSNEVGEAVVAVPRAEPDRALRIALWVLGGGAVTALIAWLLLGASGG
jgi:hypothetical protein